MNSSIKISNRLKEKLDQLPQLPGIYKMLDSKGNIIYIGKSKSLKKRVRTYFTGNPKQGKMEKLSFFIHDIDYIVTDTHLEARLLECRLIKEVKPYFNSQMKNDGKYVYLKVEDYNKFNPLSVVPHREQYTYGPFRQGYSLCNIIESLKFIFPIAKKNESYELDYHIIPLSMDQETFDKNREILIELFSDSKNMQILVNILEQKMKEAAKLYKFETASKYRDIMRGLNYINHGIWHYKHLMSRDILLKIPISKGYKLFFISHGNILLKKKYDNPTDKNIDSFIDIAHSIKPSLSIDKDEKASIDFRDILYSEIISLPKEMVKEIQV